MGEVFNASKVILQDDCLYDCTVVIEGNFIKINMNHEGKLDYVYPIHVLKRIELQ